MNPTVALRAALCVPFLGLLFAHMGSAQTTQPGLFEMTEPTPRKSFINDVTWPDTNGQHINAHGGGILEHDGVYYWFGESRGRRTPEVRWPPSPGVAVYSSTDLYNWKNEGIALHTVDDPESDITVGCNIERPKVIYNARTRQFVMWMHLELKGHGYGAARTALAVADSPTGPYRFIKSLRPNAGRWPTNLPPEAQSPLTSDQAKHELEGENFRKALVAGAFARRDFEGGQMARDMTLFVDPDTQKAYLIAASEENYTLGLHELTDDYLDFTGKWMRVGPGGHNEAPAVVKHNGMFYLLASGCTGWAPNEARYLTAPSIWGPWKHAGNPCVGTNPRNNLGPEKTWGGQSTFLLPIKGRTGEYIAMFDEWHPRQLQDSGHLWLPAFVRDGKLVIEWRDSWSLPE